MDDSPSHLSPGTLQLLQKSDDDRLESVRMEKWIDYGGAKEIIADLEELLVYPNRDRMPCRLIIADSNNGKTSLLKKFRRMHPSDPNVGGDTVKIPVLFAILNGPDERLLYRQLLSGLFESIPRNPKPGDMLEQLISVLLRVRPSMIMLDEANTIISGSPAKTRACFNALKFITNRTGIPIVAAGTREALNGFRSDEQMENRFEPRRMELWAKGSELRTLLKGFEMLTPLQRPSNLSSREMSDEILNRTGGLIGEMATLITKAATYAIKTKTEQITREGLNACGYQSVSKRRSML